MVIVLLFSCNFDVVVGGCEYSVYQLCYLDRKPVPWILDMTTAFYKARTQEMKEAPVRAGGAVSPVAVHANKVARR